MVASTKKPKKLRILLLPFFATSHIRPFTDLAFHLAAARPDAVECTVAITPANASIVRSALTHRGNGTVEVATYPFPSVEGLPPDVENHSTVKATDGWRLDTAAFNETLMRPVQESLIKVHSPDVLISDVHFFWNADVASGLGIPCVCFHVIGAFPSMAMFQLVVAGGVDTDTDTTTAVSIPDFRAPDIRFPVAELPEFLRNQNQQMFHAFRHSILPALKKCFANVCNTFVDLELDYCGMFVRNGHAERAYFVGPLALPNNPSPRSNSPPPCIEWLDTKPVQSVLYLCFGTLTHVSEAQLYELAMGLETSGKAFLWVVRDTKWSPPEGWRERVGDRGMLVVGWAPQTAILEHPAVGAFVTHCGWNSVLETVTAGVPVLTWPMVFEQFVTERFVTQVLGIGERLRPDGENGGLIPANSIAQTVVKFMEESGRSRNNSASTKVKDLSVKARAAVAEGGSSYSDLHRLIDDLMEARFPAQV